MTEQMHVMFVLFTAVISTVLSSGAASTQRPLSKRGHSGTIAIMWTMPSDRVSTLTL